MAPYTPTWFDWLLLAAAVVPVALTIVIWRLDRRALTLQSGRERRGAIARSFNLANRELLTAWEQHEDEIPDSTFFGISTTVSELLAMAHTSEKEAVLWFSDGQDEVARRLLQDRDVEGAHELLGALGAGHRIWVEKPETNEEWAARRATADWPAFGRAAQK